MTMLVLSFRPYRESEIILSMEGLPALSVEQRSAFTGLNFIHDQFSKVVCLKKAAKCFMHFCSLSIIEVFFFDFNLN